MTKHYFALMVFYAKSNELLFLFKVVEIARADYEPSHIDILYDDGITSTNRIPCMFPKPVHFSFLGPVDQTSHCKGQSHLY